MSGSLADALADPTKREATVVTFLVSASGLHPFGLASAFWSILVGGLMWFVLEPRR